MLVKKEVKMTKEKKAVKDKIILECDKTLKDAILKIAEKKGFSYSVIVREILTYTVNSPELIKELFRIDIE